ncbi:MAG: hypothetical protein IPM16_19320 [Chloroflexi bacterium]|nr:hypothetical protein [Chloroflexota bacterium]
MRQVHALLIMVCAAALLVAAPAIAQSAPRLPPDNDDWVNATQLVIGYDYTVPNISEATVEVDQPTVTPSCTTTAGDIISHSVWYKFSLPPGGHVHLSTSGTRIYKGLFETPDTIMAVFTGAALNSLTEVACNDDASLSSYSSELSLAVTNGTTYYVLVGTYDPNAIDPTSVLKLNTRMLHYGMNALNGSFESPLAAADWTVVNGTSDERSCGSGAYPAYAGNCAFRFIGSVGEKSKLKQTIPWDDRFRVRKNGVFMWIFFYRVMDAPIGSAKVKFKAKYSDGKPTTTVVSDLSGLATMGGYSYVQKLLPMGGKNLSSLSIQVVFKSETGSLLLDLIYAYYMANSSTREDKLLGVPAAPK